MSKDFAATVSLPSAGRIPDHFNPEHTAVSYSPIPQSLKKRWSGPGGYREMLALAFPLIVSTGAWSIQHFVDRMFLTWYSPEAIAAVTPAGMLNFTVMSFFIGTGGYINTFVAQYYGAGRYSRIGPSVWQGIYVALIGGAVHLMLIPAAGAIFGIIGHEPLVARYETVYFRILCLGAAPAIASHVMAGFFSGRGKSWPIMWVNVAAISVNIVLDYLLIFGKGGMPELGVAGAAIATAIAACFSFVVYLAIMSPRKYRKTYNTLSGWRLDAALFRRVLRYGFPNGVQFFLEIAGFTTFILLIGRKGTVFLAASNIALNINSLAYLPMIGLGMAITILVGQYLGEGDPATAERSVYSGLHVTMSYMCFIAFLYVAVPRLILLPYAAQADAGSFDAILPPTVIILRFVAFYSVFDALNIVFSYAIRGAGDTRFVMHVITLDSLFVLVIPSFIALLILDAPYYFGWLFATLFIVVLGVVFTVRFLGGKWKSMLVIERIPPVVPSSLPDAPVSEF